MTARCPRCESTDLGPSVEWLEASDRSESFHATHECKRCHERFKFTEGRSEKPRAATVPSTHAG